MVQGFWKFVSWKNAYQFVIVVADITASTTQIKDDGFDARGASQQIYNYDLERIF